MSYFCGSLYENYKGKEREEIQINELASDAYIKIADLSLVIPIVALLEPRYAFSPHSFSLGGSRNKEAVIKRRAEFKANSSRPETAPKVDRAEISIRQYQYTGERTSSQRICPLLKREWAENFCQGKHMMSMKKLPEKFYIVDHNRLDLFANHFTVGDEIVADQIKKFDLKSVPVDISCDADGKFCTAGTRTSPRTLAIWTVWPSYKPARTVRQVADSQGKAIQAFVKYAIGSEPDFLKMLAEIEAE